MIHKSLFFCLCLWCARGVFGDEVKSVSVMEGDSVTLNTDLTHIQRDDHILWMFGPNSTRIAEIYKQIISIYDIGNDTFKDRLKLDSQTGSLTIRNIRITNSGLYKLQIISNKGTLFKKFNVTVYAPLPVPVISFTEKCSSSSSERSSISSCVLSCSAMNVSHVTLSWYKGNSLLSNISVSDLNIRLSLSLEVEYQDTNTYSCVINNPITKHTQHLNITDVCKLCSDQHNSSLWVIIAVVVIVAVAVIVLAVICYWRKGKPVINQVQAHEEVLYTETTFCSHSVQSSKVDEEEHVVYSSITKR